MAKVLVYPKHAGKEGQEGKMKAAMPGVRSARHQSSLNKSDGEGVGEQREAKKEEEEEKEGGEGEKKKEKEREESNEGKEKTKGLEEGGEEADSDYRFIAFCRIFSGTLKRGQSVYLLGNQYVPAPARGGDKEGEVEGKEREREIMRDERRRK